MAAARKRITQKWHKMKKTLKLMAFVLLAFGLFACGEMGKKLTNEDLREAEKTLFNEDKSLNVEAAPGVAEKYCQFVKQHPKDSTAARWLYHAMEIHVLLKNADQSIALGDQMLKDYPQSEWAPMSLFLLGSFVYDEQLNDTARAHVAYQRLIDDYPNSPLVDDAQKSIEFLGMTPEEIMETFLTSTLQEGEENE